MNTRLNKIAGWIVFFVMTFVYYLSAERVGSLWDVGEFITGAYKLEVVHPPGAPLYLLIGRLFTMPAQLFSSDPSAISFSANFMSGILTALGSAMLAWTTGMLGMLIWKAKDKAISRSQEIALAGAGLVAGLSMGFSTSIWFSAVEGEVYGMSTFFTCLVLWSAIKWYTLPDNSKSDRWLLFTIYAAGLSIGVHLLSLLAFPTIGMLYYYKKYDKNTLGGTILAALAGVLFFTLIVQKLIIVGIPQLWLWLELFTVNSLGMPFFSGLIPLFLFLAALFYFGFREAHRRSSKTLQFVLASLFLLVTGFSTMGIIVVRANANTPINMNAPSDPFRLLPYINREQYGERELLYGPWYKAQPIESVTTPKYGRVGDHYEHTDYKVDYVYNKKDLSLLPRMQDPQGSRAQIYDLWRGGTSGSKRLGKPSLGENIAFMVRYQINWMYWRYFMWNFVGRQNGDQGFYSWDKRAGHWMSGIKPIDEARLYNMDAEPEIFANDKSRNLYYGIPLILGLLGLFFHYRKRPQDANALIVLFVITGLGIIFYSNQPPNEPRERDYVLVGSFLTYCIWIGMAVMVLYELLSQKLKLGTQPAAIAACAIALLGPLLMGTQNYDDHTRGHITASRDYAANFLNSTEENQGSIMFTYGDNDTYPLWYVQETENIRTDVRVANLSLIAVDWYIEQLRRKVNDSPAVKFTISPESYRGNKRNTVPIIENQDVQEMSIQQALTFINKDIPNPTNDRRRPLAYLPTRNIYIPVDRNKVLSNGTVRAEDADKIVDRIYLKIPESKNYLIKDELAILDLIGSNLWDRPVYFAVTARAEKMFGLQDYMQMEGLALRIVPIKTTRSPQRDQYGEVYGAGFVSDDILIKNVIEKFKWGNFDKFESFIDKNYGPSIQSMRIAMMRTGRDLLSRGDTTRAVLMADQYFEAFPHINFPYNYHTTHLANIYLAAKEYDKAKPHIEILVEEANEHLEFYSTLDPEDLQGGFSFQEDQQLWQRVASQTLLAAEDIGDAALKEKAKNLLEPYLDERFRIPETPQN